jgi:putative MATE family efflux protein
MTVDALEATRAAPANPLLTGPILPTLTKLAAPNLVALLAMAGVVVAETAYIGRLGVEPLAAMALVFPLIMLTQMMSSGAMGGGVSSAIARALGAGDHDRARTLAAHALLIGLGGGLVFTVGFLLAAPGLFAALGGRGHVLEEALAYAGAFFTGASAIWVFNTLASIARGTGNMLLPSSTAIGVAITQILLGGALALGLAGFPRLGIRGVAFGQVTAYTLGALVLIVFLRSADARVRIGFAGVRYQWSLFKDILKVGAIACLSPLMSVGSVLVLARLVANFDTATLAGYGIGVRLEFLLVPIAFGYGVACVPMVGMAIGAGHIARARRVAWTGATLSAVIIGVIGLVAMVFPDAWTGFFTTNPDVRAAAATFLRIAAFGFPFYGFGLCLYFAAQGSGNVFGPVAAQALRFATIVAGGWWLAKTGAGPTAMFALIAVAMMIHGLASGLFVRWTRWGPPDRGAA